MIQAPETLYPITNLRKLRIKQFNNIGSWKVSHPHQTLVESKFFYKKLKKNLKDFFVDAVDHDVADLDPMLYNFFVRNLRIFAVS